MSGDAGGLVARLRTGDGEERDRALAEAIELGAAAIAPLRAELERADAPLRALIMEALASIADGSCAGDFHAALEDGDQRVRAWAAAGLARIGDPGAVAALIRTFDDHGPELHGPHTLSSFALVARGPAVLPRVVPLLRSPNAITRERAYRVIADVVTGTVEYAHRWRELSAELGGFDPAGTEEERDEAAARWADWVGRFAEDG